MTVAQFLETVRFHLNEPSSVPATAKKWTDHELCTYGYHIITNDYFARLLAANNNFYDWYYDISVVAGTQTYTIPYQIIKEVQRLEKLDTDLVPVFDFWQISSQDFIDEKSYDGYYFETGGTELTFTWSPSIAETRRIWFKRLPWEFHYGNPAAHATEAGVILDFDTSPAAAVNGAIRYEDDIYNGAIIQITVGTGLGLRRRITDFAYNGTLAEATVDSAWGARFPLTGSTYEVIIPLPEQYHLLLAMDTALAAKAKFNERVDSLIAMRNQLYSSLFSQAGERLGYRTFAED